MIWVILAWLLVGLFAAWLIRRFTGPTEVWVLALYALCGPIFLVVAAIASASHAGLFDFLEHKV